MSAVPGKFCVNCVHSGLIYATVYVCQRRNLPGTVDLVTGVTLPTAANCIWERAEKGQDRCGPEGQFFKAKESK